MAEAEYQISLEPLRPSVRRTVYEIKVSLSSVLDLSSADALQTLGLSLPELAAMDHTRCQMIGGAVEYLEHDGVLVPSARASKGTNLVIYPNKRTADYEFSIVSEELVFDPDANHKPSRAR